MPDDPKTADSLIRIGASWYPEMWPEDEWPKDVARMKELGFNIVRLFEFAWHRFEPREGEYDFDWALKVLDLCHKARIAVMAGTPTAAPPAWLTSAYPEVLQTGPDGRVRKHGQRKHYSHLSGKYRELCARIVGRMAAALGRHPALHSWQIDNEMGGHDYGPETRKLFQAWLQERYGSIEELNRAWGLEFWSQAYNSFEQVPLATASVGSVEVPERHHPSLLMAIAHFQNEGWTEFIRRQCDAIRAVSDKPITTNMTGLVGAMDWFRHNRYLDRVGASVYADVAHYHWNVARFDRLRAEKPAPFWLLETAPNWSGGGRIWNIHHDARGVRAMAWKSVLLGGSMVLFWQWRQHWAGQEMQHGTMLTATGRWRPNRRAWALVAGEFARHGRWLLDHPPQPAPLALMLSTQAAWAFSIDPTDEQMDYQGRWRDDYYLPLLRRHIWRDVIHESHDFAPYRIILIPHMPILAGQTRRRLKEWVERGGRLVLGPLTGYRSEEFTVFRDREFGGLEELMGAESALSFTVHWVEDRVNVDFGAGLETRTSTWCEAFQPTTGKALAFYRGGYGDGQVAAMRNSFGKGAVVTLGCRVNEKVYIKLVRGLMDEAGVSPLATGAQEVLVAPRAAPGGSLAGYGLVNLSEAERSITLRTRGTDRLTGRALGAAVQLSPLEVVLLEVAV